MRSLAMKVAVAYRRVFNWICGRVSEEVAFKRWAHMEVVNLVPRFSVGTGRREPWERGWEVVWLNIQNRLLSKLVQHSPQVD